MIKVEKLDGYIVVSNGVNSIIISINPNTFVTKDVYRVPCTVF